MTAADSLATMGPEESGSRRDCEDVRKQRGRLAAVWLSAGSAVAAMVAVSWYVIARNGGLPPGGDMIGHAAAAEWLRTLPWWDWRGWSDWFFGGQAIGVNYPPLAHAWMRFTHPVHGQMAAVAVGLLVLLPWGALQLARSVGYAPRAQRAAVAGVLVLTAAAGNMHWVLSGFHYTVTFFGSWPAMIATAAGLFCAAWAARCHRPLACGLVAGLAILFNATVVPGVVVVCVALVVSSGASFRQGVRWAATAGAAALTVCAWWLVPFIAGWGRLVRWMVPLSVALDSGDIWQIVVLAALGGFTAWAFRTGCVRSRRLALVAAAGLVATLLADLFNYLRPERWLALPILVACVTAAAAVSLRGQARWRPARPAWLVIGLACSVVLVVITGRLEVIPLVIWLSSRSRRSWVAAGALAWFGVLLWVPFLAEFSSAPERDLRQAVPLEVADALDSSGSGGLVYLDGLYNTAAGDVVGCAWGHPWRTTSRTEGRIRPLFGLYRETSPTAEFLDAEFELRSGAFELAGGRRPHWFDTWQIRGGPSLDTAAAAATMGARWYASCDVEGNVLVTEVPGTLATAVPVKPYASEEEWHRAAVEWWVSIVTSVQAGAAENVAAVPILSSGETTAHPTNQLAIGVSLEMDGESLTIHADEAGWAWLRVPWDPYWRTLGDSPVRKGGPGHLLVWANQGATELRWSVPGAVDVAAAATTGTAVICVAILAHANRRRSWAIDVNRHRPAAEALHVFADTVDGWAHAARGRVCRLVDRIVSRVRS